MFPEVSTATELGPNKFADVAALPSPIKLFAPLPAIVEITPVEIVTLRTRLFSESAMNTLPVEIK